MTYYSEFTESWYRVFDDMTSQVSPLGGGSFILSATQWEINTFLLTISSISHTEHKIDG